MKNDQLTMVGILASASAILTGFSLSAVARVEHLTFSGSDDDIRLISAGDSPSLPTIIIDVAGADILIMPRGKNTLLALPVTEETLVDGSYDIRSAVLIDVKRMQLSDIELSFTDDGVYIDTMETVQGDFSKDFMIWAKALMTGENVSTSFVFNIDGESKQIKAPSTLALSRHVLGAHQHSVESFITFVSQNWDFDSDKVRIPQVQQTTDVETDVQSKAA